jgi:uncharacterized damage-inducible protein DinB
MTHAFASPERLVQHMIWADLRLLEALQDAEVPPATLARMAHVLAAEEIWLERLQGRDAKGLEVWPAHDLATCQARATRLHAAWTAFIRALDPEAASAEVPYHTSTGAPQRHSVSDMVTHVMLHGAHHRGQIAADLRAAGGVPPNVDFMGWVRAGGAG